MILKKLVNVGGNASNKFENEKETGSFNYIKDRTCTTKANRVKILINSNLSVRRKN